MEPTPASPETTGTAPSTIGDASASLAMAFADSSAAAPTTETPAPSETPTAATVQAEPEAQATEPVSAQETPQDAEQKKEPPQWRWQDILETQRTKAAQEAEARVRQEVEQQYAWAKAVSDEERQFLAWKARDPQAATAWLAQQQGQTPAADPEPEPDAAIRLDNGQTVPVYTPEGKRAHDAWLRRNLATELKTEFQKEFQPLVSTSEKLRQYEQQVQAQQASQQWAKQTLAPLERLPYFAEFKPELGKALAALPATATNDDMMAAVYDTYTTLHTAKLQTLQKTGDAKALATLQSRAVMGSTNPASAATATPAATLGNARAALEMAFADEARS